MNTYDRRVGVSSPRAILNTVGNLFSDNHALGYKVFEGPDEIELFIHQRPSTRVTFSATYLKSEDRYEIRFGAKTVPLRTRVDAWALAGAMKDLADQYDGSWFSR